MSVPAAPGAAPSQEVAVLNFASAKDTMWMEVTVANLQWLRGFIRAEREAQLPTRRSAAGQAAVPDEDKPASKGPGAAAASSDHSPRKKAHWCGASATWRVRYWDGQEWQIKNMFVRQRPSQTFEARCAQMHVAAMDFYDLNHREVAQ